MYERLVASDESLDLDPRLQQLRCRRVVCRREVGRWFLTAIDGKEVSQNAASQHRDRTTSLASGGTYLSVMMDSSLRVMVGFDE
jgi:hypothetical protein